MFTQKQMLETNKEILDSFNGNIPVTPIMFFLNYWYLKSIYTGDRKVPNINVLNTSTAVMLALMLSNTNKELENVKIDDLAKYCVHKALTIEKYTDGVNLHILTTDSGIDWDTLDECVDEVRDKGIGGQLIEYIRQQLKH
jgi:ribosomal protein S8